MSDALTHVKVKVCGLTEVDNAVACAESGVEWIGLNFHPASPRSITPERGAEIAGALRRAGLGVPVALFVNRPVGEVLQMLRRVGAIDIIQLHGDESPEYLLECASAHPGLRVVRAFRLRDESSVDRMRVYLDRSAQLGCSPFAILVDAHAPGQLGGTGHAIPASILDHLPDHPRLILAGGLDPSNVAGRAALVRPWMVDVASGVETSPGVKDVAKVAALVAALRGTREIACIPE